MLPARSRGRGEMVAAAFLPGPEPLPGPPGGGLRSSAAASCPRPGVCGAAQPPRGAAGGGRRRVHVAGRRAQPDPSSGGEDELVRAGRGAPAPRRAPGQRLGAGEGARCGDAGGSLPLAAGLGKGGCRAAGEKGAWEGGFIFGEGVCRAWTCLPGSPRL